MNTKPKIDEIKVLAPVRAAMRGWHSCDRGGLTRRIHEAYEAVGELVKGKKLPYRCGTWYKAYREIRALEDRLDVMAARDWDAWEDQMGSFFTIMHPCQDPYAPVQLAP